MEKSILSTAHAERTGKIPKATFSPDKGSMGILVRDPIHKKGRHVSEYTQFKVIVQDRKMADLFCSMLSSQSYFERLIWWTGTLEDMLSSWS